MEMLSQTMDNVQVIQKSFEDFGKETSKAYLLPATRMWFS
jgi:hypothetical protein